MERGGTEGWELGSWGGQRGQKPETRGQKAEGRRQGPETRDQRPETRDLRPETRGTTPVHSEMLEGHSLRFSSRRAHEVPNGVAHVNRGTLPQGTLPRCR